jgi:site-specific recombinase XerD
VRSTIAWIRDAFAAAARREARFGTARLVLIDVDRVQEHQQALPSLEEFAASRGLEDFSHAEQLEAFQGSYGKESRRQARRARLVRKQLEALRCLEALASRPPAASDPVSAWLNPAIAHRLEMAGVFTLAQLVERVNGLGRGWTASMAGIGTVKGARVLAWLQANAQAIGMPIGLHVERRRTQLLKSELAAVVPPGCDIRPIEKLIVPRDLDGQLGLFRRPQDQCLIDASNDYAAVLTSLRSKAGLTPQQRDAARARRRSRDTASYPAGEGGGVEDPFEWLGLLSHTQRAYRKEAERFMLWALVERRKPLSSMNTEDCIAYRDFIADPQPRARWCAPRNRERWSPLWRPFEQPLDLASQRYAVTVLKNLYAFWVDKNYVMGNPWTGVFAARPLTPRINTGRSFTMAQWRFVQAQAERLPGTSTGLRLRFALALLYATGLRLSEVVAARVDDLKWVEYPPDADDDDHVQGWLLDVVGKGSRVRQVPVPVAVAAELGAYLRSRGLAADPTDPLNAGAFLLGKATDIAELAPGLKPVKGFDAKEGISQNTLYDQFKGFFEACSRVRADLGDAYGATRLAKASTHWLRHTHASHSIARGTRVEVEQQILGHASLATTSVYVTTEHKRRMKAMAAFWSGQ